MERDWPISNENTPERVDFLDVTSHLNNIETQSSIADTEIHIAECLADDTERATCEIELQDKIFGWRKLPRQAEIKGVALRFSDSSQENTNYEMVQHVTIKDARMTAIDLMQLPGSDSYKAMLETWSRSHQAYYYFFLDNIDSLVIKMNSIHGDEIIKSLNVLYESITEKVMTVDFLSRSSEQQHQVLGKMVSARNKILEELINKEVELHAEADRFYTIHDDMPVMDLSLQNNYAMADINAPATSASGIFVGCELADRLQWAGRIETGFSGGRAFQFDLGAPCVVLKNIEQRSTHYVPINQIKNLN